MPSSPCVRLKTPSGAPAIRFPLPWENDGYCLEWIDPHRVVMGAVKGLI